jgi:DNA-binding SARP family transcriptional activator
MSSPQLGIRLLGPLEVLDGGERLTLPPSRKARALLTYLAATGRPHPRSSLCALFWQDVNDPRAGLRWALSKLRGVVDGEGRTPIVSARNRLHFDTDQAEVDLHRVHALVSRSPEEASTEALERAARSFRGEFVEGLELSGCHQFEAWCMGERERLRKLRVSLHEILVDRLRDEPGDAVSHALTRVRLDPYAEEGYIIAMELLAEIGRTQKGLELYDRCRRTLSVELGVPPSRELEAARRRMKPSPRTHPTDQRAGWTGTTGLDGTTESEIPSLTQALANLPEPEHLPRPGPTDPPLVGRSAELARLVQAVEDGSSREVHTAILLTGEAGIGKTRLLRELAQAVRSDGGWVLSGPVFESEEVRPYGPWADMLRHLPQTAFDREVRHGLAGLLDVRGSDVRTAGPAERTQLFDLAARLLHRLTEARAPGLVILDDVQWLDPSSTALLHYLTRTLGSTPVTFALAARDGEVPPGSTVARLLRSLNRTGQLHRTDLGRLTASEVRTLVHAVDPEADAHSIFATSEGNPFFALAVAASYREGIHHTPANLQEELQHRLERLDSGARRLLPWAAALGRAFDVPTLVDAVERPASQVLEAMALLEHRGILRATGADRYDFAHDLVREAAYRQPSDPVRRQIHRRIARVLDAVTPDKGREPGGVAHHAEQGGLATLAAGAYAEAAERSLWVFAFDEASIMVERGLAQLNDVPDDERIALEMELLRIYSFWSMRERRPEGLEARVATLVDQARAQGRTSLVAMGHAMQMELQYQRGAFQEAKESSLRYADAGRQSGPETAVRALAETATCLLLLDQAPKDARRLAMEASKLAGQHSLKVDAVALARALLDHHDGDLEGASQAFQDVVQWGREANDRWWECPAMTRLIMVELDRGDPERAVARARQAQWLAERMDHMVEATFARALGAVSTAWVRKERGSGEPMEGGSADSMEMADRALRELRDLDSLWHIAQVQLYGATVDLRHRRVGAARARAREALEASRTLERPNLLAITQALLAQCAILEGDGMTATAHLQTPDVIRPDHRLSHRAREALAQAEELMRTLTPEDTPVPRGGNEGPT